MSALGVSILVGAIQVSLLGLGVGVGLVLMRHQPRAAVLTAIMGLALCLLVWLNAIGLAPSWRTLVPTPSGARSPVEARTAPTASLPSVAKQLTGGPRFKLNLDFLPSQLSERTTKSNRLDWNVLAWIICATVAVGSLRFFRAYYGLRRLRACSDAIDDPSLAALCGELRHALHCNHDFQIRACSAIQSAATIGWRRPIILVAENWRDWPVDDLRAVLAHEIAHITRGDFLAMLFSRLCVIAHAYHPFVWWISRRLAADQELAADQLASSVAGGRSSYLQTLARMALLDDDSSSSALARSFLNGGSTLLRRIAMLKKPEPRMQATWAAWTLRTALAMIAVLVSVMEGPAETPVSKSPNAALAPLDLSFVPKDSKLFIALRPAAMAQHEGMAKWVERLEWSLNISWADEPAFVFPLRDIDQVIFYGEFFYAQIVGQPSGKQHYSEERIAMIRMTKDYDWPARLRAMQKTVAMEEIKPNCFVIKDRPGRPEYQVRVVDSRTITFVPEDRISSTPPKERWGCAAEPFQSAAVVLGIDNRDTTFGRFLAAEKLYKSIEGLSQLLDTAKHAAIAVDNSPVAGGTLLVDCWDPFMATADCDKALRAIGDFARKSSTEALAKKESLSPLELFWFDFANQLVKRDEFETKGSRVRLVSRTKVRFADVFGHTLPPIFHDDAGFEKAREEYNREKAK